MFVRIWGGADLRLGVGDEGHEMGEQLHHHPLSWLFQVLYHLRGRGEWVRYRKGIG